jgi:hypothetical protein
VQDGIYDVFVEKLLSVARTARMGIYTAEVRGGRRVQRFTPVR